MIWMWRHLRFSPAIPIICTSTDHGGSADCGCTSGKTAPSRGPFFVWGSAFQHFRVKRDVIGDEALNKPIGMVVTVATVEDEFLSRRGGGLF